MASGTALVAIGGTGSAGSVNGGNHGGAGGGGSGGGIILNAATINSPSAAMAFVLGGAGGPGSGTGGGGGGGGRTLYHMSSYTAGDALALPSPQLNGAAGGTTGGTAGAFGSARLDVDTTFVPAGQVFSFAAASFNEFTTTNMFVETGGVASAIGNYNNAGTISVAAGSAFTGTGTLRGNTWLVSGGAINALGGFSLDGSTLLSGRGTVNGTITSSDSQATIHAMGGALTIGDANATGGINYAGQINVGVNGQAASLILLAADHAVIADTTLTNGTLSAPNGTTLRAGATLTAPTASSIGGDFSNSGTVAGPTAAGAFLTFTDDVNGAGNYTGNVKFSDGFSPGNSPADVTLENVAFDSTADLTMELGGKTEGSQYDRLTILGKAALDGTLEVTLIDGFVPSVGDSFLLLNGGALSGSFAAVDLPALPAGEQWAVDQGPGSLTAAVVPEPGALAMASAGLVVLGWRRRRA